jgi:hypothetical protein
MSLNGVSSLAGADHLHLTNEQVPFTLQSINRSKTDPRIRFWKKGNRSAGSGYIQLPVIYLILKRLIPLGEEKDSEVSTSKDITLTPEEVTWFSEHYQSIMINRSDSLSAVDYVTSPNKKTLELSQCHFG